jgi:cell division protein FtsL
MPGATDALGAAGGATPWGAIAGIGLGLIGGIGKMFGRAKANRELKRLQKEDPTYSADPRIMQMANQRLGLANTLLAARMPGAATAERNIMTNQANQLAGLNRGATDASQALAVAAGIGGQTNQSFENLGQAEAQDYYRRLGIQGEAQQGVMNEAQRIEGNTYNDQLRKYQNKMDIQGAIQQNRQNTWGDISNLGFGLADFGMSGGFDNLFGATNRSVANGLSSGNINNQRVLNAPIQRTGVPRFG